MWELVTHLTAIAFVKKRVVSSLNRFTSASPAPWIDELAGVPLPFSSLSVPVSGVFSGSLTSLSLAFDSVRTRDSFKGMRF